jgi:hypothetical protein
VLCDEAPETWFGWVAEPFNLSDDWKYNDGSWQCFLIHRDEGGYCVFVGRA